MTLAAKKFDRERATPLRITPAAPKRQVAPMLIGAIVIVIGALVSGLAATKAGERESVLAVAHSVPAGEIIKTSDVVAVRISTDPGLKPISASAKSTVVGHPAAVSLVPGTLFTSAAIGPSTELPADQSQIGLSLKAGQFPPGLAAGQRVRVIDVDPATPSTLVEGGVVVSVSPGSTSESGSAVIELRVPSERMNAVAVASASASGHVSLGLLGS